MEVIHNGDKIILHENNMIFAELSLEEAENIAINLNRLIKQVKKEG